MNLAKWFFTAAAITASTVAVADPFPNGDYDRSPEFAGKRGHERRREELAENIIQQARYVEFLLQQNAKMMNREQLFEVNQLLARIEQAIRGGVAAGRPEPGRPGGPGMPNPPGPGVPSGPPLGPSGPGTPTPPLPPFYPRSCAEANTAEMIQAMQKIRNFAYSGSGLNMDSSGAAAYAQSWVQQYFCEEADSWVSEGRKIRNFAYSGSGLNLSSHDAAVYTQNALNRRCYDQVDYVSEASRIYQFAYSGSGLNLSSREASEYTRQQMDQRFFSCGDGRR
jgi:hypothetical protein